MASLKYWVWLSARPGIGAAAKLRLLEWFGAPEQIFFADEQDYAAVPGLGRGDVSSLLDKSLLSAGRILDDCLERGYRIVTLNDGEYPVRLRNIADPPLVLYIRGRLPVMDEEAAVAVVGTRRCTPYGIKAAERLGYELARHGCLVVTGLARGIDTAAAMGALRAGGRVVGVVGSGLDVVYPPENELLFEDAAAVGALISEYPPGTPAAGEHFPRRNRILSGVSAGVVVVEAPLNSGALITAAYALEQGRDVFSVPGNIDAPTCEGSNKLLREGAVPVTSGKEIAEEYAALYSGKIRLDRKKTPLSERRAEKLAEAASVKNRLNTAKKEIDKDNGVEYIDLVKLRESLGADEFKVISSVGPGLRHIDEIIVSTGLQPHTVLSALTMLELGGYVEQSRGKYFKLVYEPKTK